MANQQTTQANGNNVNPAVNGEALKNVEADEQRNVQPKDPKGSDERFLERVSHPILVDSITRAGSSFKTAINLEVAVSLIVYARFKGNNLKAKKEIYSVYKDAGYDCEVGGNGRDYKTVNRRAGYIEKFFENVMDTNDIEEVIGDARDAEAVQQLVNHLTTEYNFRSMNDVLHAAGVEPPSEVWANEKKKAKTSANTAAVGNTSTKAGGAKGDALPQGTSGEGGVDAATGQPLTKEGEIDKRTKPADNSDTAEGVKTRMENNPNPLDKLSDKIQEVNPEAADEGDKGVAAAVQAQGEERANRRATDNSDKWIRVQHDGIIMVIPVDVKADDLHELGTMLIRAAAKMDAGGGIESVRQSFPQKEEAAH